MHISAVRRTVDQDKPLAVSEIPVEPEEFVDYWLPPFPVVLKSAEEPESGAVPNQAKVEEDSDSNLPNLPPNPPNPPPAPGPLLAAGYVTQSGRTSRPLPYLADFVNYTALMASNVELNSG